MEDSTPTRPNSVLYAVCLLCAAGLIDAWPSQAGGEMLVGPRMGLLAIAVLSFAVMRGHAWARGIFLVWCALKFSIFLTQGLYSLADGQGFHAPGIVSTTLLIVACELLFRKPAFLWFAEKGSERYRKRLRA